MKENLPNCIQNLVFELNNQVHIDNQIVAGILSETKLSEQALKPYFYTNHPANESYGRKLIWDNGDFKILLMTWLPGDFTAIHNHGHADWGGVYFFGDATHRLYEVENNELALVEKTIFPKGQVASICGDLTHLMGNSGSNEMVTLHIYGSNTRKENVSQDAKVYLPEFQKIVTTMGSAYLNMDKELILSEKPFESKNTAVLADYFSLVKPFYERNKMPGVIQKMDNYLNHN